MTRGGRRQDRDGPERRCIATGESLPAAGLIRFVLGPDAAVVPDVEGRLPGRGVWLTADRALVATAVKKRLFSRAFRGEAKLPEDLADMLERLLAARLIGLVSLARKAGQAVTGFEKVRERLRKGKAAVLVAASDGAADGRTKLVALAPGLPVLDVLDGSELGLAFGRDFAIHAALDAGGLADRALAEARRLRGFRMPDPAGSGGLVTTERDARGHQDMNAGTGPIAGPDRTIDER